MLFPQCFDSVVGLLPLGNGRSPITEEGPVLVRCPFLFGNRQNLPDPFGQRVGHWILGGRDRKPKTTEIIVLIVVAVPASVSLAEMNGEQCSVGMRNRFLQDKDRFARLIPPSGTDVNAPGGLGFAVDGNPCSASEFVSLIEQLCPVVEAMDVDAQRSSTADSGSP